MPRGSLRSPSLVGRRFDRRIVLSRGEFANGKRSRWLVRCDCGREFYCLRQDLRRGGPCRNCSQGLKNPRPYRCKRPYEAQYNAWVGRARHEVQITYEQFVQFTNIGECHYCGEAIRWMRHVLKGTKRTNASNLDRKDCGLPYTEDNVVICCWRCNKAKNTLFTYGEWKQIGDLIRSWRDETSKP